MEWPRSNHHRKDIRDFINKSIEITAAFDAIKGIAEILSVEPITVAGIPFAVCAIYLSSQTLIDLCKEYNEAKRLEGGMEAEHYAIIKKINERAVKGMLKEEDYEAIEYIAKEVERQETEDKYTFESNKGSDDLDRGHIW